MRRSLPFVYGLLVCGCIPPPGLRPSSFSAETLAAKSSPHSRGFLQSASQGINPGDRDYGAGVEEWRRRAVRQSIENPFFWTLLIACLLMTLAFATIVVQRNERERREMIAAELLAQYHNAWVYATRQAQDAITRHNSFVENTNRANEAADLLNVNLAMIKAETERESASSPTSVFLKGNLRPKSDGSTAGEPRYGPKPRNLRQPEPDIVAQLHTLQQQLDASCERERNLEMQLKKLTRSPVWEAEPGG